MMFLEKIKQNPIATVNMVYCIFPILSLSMMQSSGPLWLGVLVTIQFILGYVLLCYRDMSHNILLRRLILLMHYVGIIYFIYFFDGYYFYFYFYSAFILPFALRVTYKSLEMQLYVSAMLFSFAIITVRYPSLWVMMLAILIVLLGMTMANFSSVKTQKLKDELMKKNAHINMLIADYERNRIGQDLHDTLGHIFASLSIKSELATKLLENKRVDQAREELASIHQLSRDALVKVRAIVEDVKFQSFEEEVQTMAILLENANITFQFEHAESTQSLQPTIQATLAMILREMVNNVIKHAKAKTVTGQMIEDGSQMIFIFEDDGVGMTHITQDDFKSIRQRVQALDGVFDVQNLEKGLRIVITFSKGTECK
ncbi:sensor histidine kinase [Staphylococcus microti]|nr:sensor histidine kinase [Staphylococcus microti]